MNIKAMVVNNCFFFSEIIGPRKGSYICVDDEIAAGSATQCWAVRDFVNTLYL